MTLVRYSYPTTRFFTPAVGSFARSPWSGLEAEIDRLFETALTDFSAPATNRFPVDVFEDKDNAYVRAELPGINREELSVELVDGYLNLSAARKTTEEQAAESFSFARSIAVPDDVQADKVSATYDHGVLTVTLPKREEAKPKKIAIAVK
jgi:HSP20 family protein